MRQRHVGPELRQLRVDARRDGERRGRDRPGIGRTWTHAPRAEPRGHALAQQDRQSEARPLMRTPLSERRSPQRFVTRYHGGDRGRSGGEVGGMAQRRFFSARRKARSRLRGCTSSPKRA
jgi:hypothetical protein